MLILLFLAITVASAVLWHRYLPRYLLASVAAAVTSVSIYQTGVAIHENFNSPYTFLGVVVTLPIAFVVSILVGAPTRKRRKRIEGNRNAV